MVLPEIHHQICSPNIAARIWDDPRLLPHSRYIISAKEIVTDNNY